MHNFVISSDKLEKGLKCAYVILSMKTWQVARDQKAEFAVLALFYPALILKILCSPKNFWGEYSHRLVRPSVRPIRVRPITSLIEVGFRNYFTEMTTLLRRRVARKI